MSAEPWQNSITHYGEEAPDQLLAHPLNPKHHPKAQQDALAGAIGELGWLAPVVVNETTGHVIDGHARIGLAISRHEAKVPVAYVALTEAQEALALATFDPIGALAAIDKDNLDALLQGVTTDDAAVRRMLSELADENGLDYGRDGRPLLEAPEAEVDRAEELREKWGVKTGDLWIIGRHRLLCGDSTKAEDVERLMGGEKPDIVLADPPYGMNLTGYAGGDNTFHGKTLHQRTPQRVMGDDVAFDPSLLIPLYGCKEQFWWGGDWYYTTLPPGGAWIIWDKRGSEEADAVLGAPFEVCWSRQRHARKFIRKSWGGIFSKERGDPERWHATQKPIVLMQTILDWHAPPDGLVLDPFVGSGAVPLAAEQAGRRCFGMEIEPKYVAVTLERLSAMGLAPRLVNT